MRRETLIPMAIAHRATEDTTLSGYNIPKVSTCVYLNVGQAHIKINGKVKSYPRNRPWRPIGL
jgi:hypothetical protein